MNLSSRQPGPTNGLYMTMFVNQADYLYAMSSSAGYRVCLLYYHFSAADLQRLISGGCLKLEGILTELLSLSARVLRAGIVFDGVCASVCLSAQNLKNY